jgi:hypothetical protein
MAIRTLLLLLWSFALGSCASQPTWTSAHGSAKPATGASPSPRQYAWDGLGQNPKRPRSHRVSRQSSKPEQASNLQREAALAELRPYSAAWWVVHDEIEADREANIARKLVICRGCISTESQVGMTASIGGR